MLGPDPILTYSHRGMVLLSRIRWVYLVALHSSWLVSRESNRKATRVGLDPHFLGGSIRHPLRLSVVFGWFSGWVSELTHEK